MTIAPERESLEELDFPTPEVESLPTGTVVDGLVDPEMIPTLAPAVTPELIAAVQERTRQEIMALAPATVVVGWERDGVVHTQEVVMTRLGPLLATDWGFLSIDHAYAARGWTCYCSPSRSMLMAETRLRGAGREAARRRQRRQQRMLAGLFAAWMLAGLLLMLV